MIKHSCTPKAVSISRRLAVTCAFSVLAACNQGSSSSNTTADAAGNAMGNSLADALPPATALPLAAGPAPAYTPARAVSALPPAPIAPLGRVPPTDQYAYLNKAYAFSQSLADAPPDYTYDYQGERPWVWQSPDGYYRVAERLPMGVRYFYYAPGASEPYLVQDPQYSYGYSGGRLTVVYGPDGQVLPYDVEARQARDAGLYLAWAAGLYAAARHEEHVAVSQDRWNAERQAVYADQARWREAQQRNAAWASYGQAHQNDQAHWADQRYARAAEAARFAQTVNDRTALAHAQQSAVDARAIAQSRAERPPGAAAERGLDRNPPGAPAFAPPVQPVGDPLRDQRQQTFQRQQAAEQAGGPKVRAERPTMPQTGFDRREPQAAPVRSPGPAASDLATAQDQQAVRRQQAAVPAQARERGAEQAQATATDQRQIERQNGAQGLAQTRQAQVRDKQADGRQAEAAAAGRAAADRATADAHLQADKQAQVQRTAQTAAVRREPQTPAHAETVPAAPHPQAPPAKGKPKPEEPPH